MKPLLRLAPWLLLLGAAPAVSSEDWVRQGNAAFAREDYALALDLYARAEATTTDPGLVVLNKGTALYRLGRHREAQLHFERGLEEADTARRPTLLYNLGNSLLHQAQAGSELALFREAVACYERCLSEGASDALRDNVRYNLELTKLLWFQARLTRPESEKQPPGTEPKTEPPPKQKDQTDVVKKEPGADPSTSTQPNPQEKVEKKGPAEGKQGQPAPLKTDQTVAGAGNLPAPRDEAELRPLAPEDALKHLAAAAERIRRERSAYMLRAAPSPARGVPDW